MTKRIGQNLIEERAHDYNDRMHNALQHLQWDAVEELANALMICFEEKRQVFICGNGGSGANAIHMANDFLYGVTKQIGRGLRCKALTANNSIITCLANDEGYSEIFAYQIAAEGNPQDVLLVLSGSGNSPNIIRALEEANAIGLSTFGILGFDGGKALNLVQTPIHAKISDMQISEDIQMIIAHIISQWMFDKLSEQTF